MPVLHKLITRQFILFKRFVYIGAAICRSYASWILLGGAVLGFGAGLDADFPMPFGFILGCWCQFNNQDLALDLQPGEDTQQTGFTATIAPFHQ